MDSNNLTTYFAPAERIPFESVLLQSTKIKSLFDVCDVCSIFDISRDIILILNRERQIIYCNSSLLDWLNIKDYKKVLGARLGEIIGCINAFQMVGGCGTSEACCVCEAPKAILKSQEGKNVQVECRITVMNNNQIDSLDLEITTTPVNINSEMFTILDVRDISDEKRRRALENIFFHDIMNTAGVIHTLSQLLYQKSDDPIKIKNLLQFNQSMVNQLVEEIKEQRDLLKAENNELIVDMTLVHSIDVLNVVTERYINDKDFEHVNIQIDKKSIDIVINSNPKLLRRVLGNMLKNALEASRNGETVRLGCYLQEGYLLFWVNNPEPMSREIQLQVFQRSFSTKERNRGLGTYSMKLLTERYLNGTIYFLVSEEEGTTFYAKFPIIT